MQVQLNFNWILISKLKRIELYTKIIIIIIIIIIKFGSIKIYVLIEISIKLNLIELNWIETNWIQSNSIQLCTNWLDSSKPIWFQFGFQFKPNWIQLNYEILITRRCMLILFFNLFSHYPCKWVGEKSEMLR